MVVAANEAFFLTGSTLTSLELRQYTSLLIGGVTGVVGDSSLLVRPSSPQGLTLRVAAGAVIVAGTEAPTQGHYLCTFPAGSVAVEAASATQHRIDLVVAQVRDATYGAGSTNEVEVLVVRGTNTAAGSEASPPDVPDSAAVLAEVQVPAGATALGAANLTDRRSLVPHILRSPTGLVENANFADGVVDEDVLASAAVATDKIQDRATTEPKLASASVSDRTIANAVYKVYTLQNGTYEEQSSNSGANHRSVYSGATEPPGTNYEVGDIWVRPL